MARGSGLSAGSLASRFTWSFGRMKKIFLQELPHHDKDVEPAPSYHGEEEEGEPGEDRDERGLGQGDQEEQGREEGG